MLSGLVTVGLLLLFVAIWVWAWQPRNKASFDATARLALEDDESGTPVDSAAPEAQP